MCYLIQGIRITQSNTQFLLLKYTYIQGYIFQLFGPTKEKQIWGVKTSEELDKLIKHKNIVNYIKARRLGWFGHVQKMPDTRTVKKIFN
jgi:hypothetical protein